VSQDNSTLAARLDWAASFITRGLSVLILHDVSAGQCSCLPRWDGRPCPEGSQGKHPRAGNWRAAGLSVMAQVESELARYPMANLGILTGPDSGIWVLDVDPRHGGALALTALETKHGKLPDTYRVRTGSGGWHFYFLLPDDFTPTNANRLPVGLDTRGAGGQVVAPGSVTLFGSYTVERDVPPVPAPEWLLDCIRPVAVTERATPEEYAAWREMPVALMEPDGDPRLRVYAAAAVSRELAALEQAVPGARGSTAFKVAAALIELCNSPWAGLSPALVRAAYDRAADVAMSLGGDFDEAEASQSWDSAARRVGHTGRAVPAELDAGGVVPGVDFTAGAGVPPFGGAASTATPPAGGLANPFALPQQRASSEREVSEQRAALGMLDPEVARRVRQMEVDAQAKAIMKARAEAGSDAAARRRALREQMMSASQMAAAPGPEPLVAGLLNVDTTAWMIGKSGTYKSFVALDLAAHVARGMDWQGRKTAQGTVVYIVAEGARGMSLRVKAWEARHGPIGDNLIFLPRPVSAADEQAWGDLAAVIGEIKPVLVIGDTQARLSVGLQENDNSEMMRFVAAVDQLRTASGACVLTVHHIGRQGTDARGASSIDGAQDTELRIERTGTRALRIYQDKQKDADDEAALDLTLELEGESLVVSAAALVNPFMTPERAREEKRDRKRAAMLDVAIDLLRDVYATGMGGTKAEIRRAVFERMGRPDPGDERHSTWDKAWNRLVTEGVMAKIKGTASWLYIPVDDRRKLVEPVAGGSGFYAPSDGPTT
jgi:hypothetical protein